MTTLERQVEELSLRLAALESRRLDELTLEGLAGDLDTFWLLFGTVMVFWMQAGFALLECGSVSAKNIWNILIKNIFDASIASLTWWATGHTLAYGGGDRYGATGENGFAGTQGFFYDYNARGTKHHVHFQGKAFFMFQWAFAGAAATIVSGAVAERCSFSAYLSYATLLTGFVYPCVAHMTWSGDGIFSAFRATSSEDDPRTGGRLLGGCGVIDFAGSGTVHMTGGVAACVACIFVGPRTGRFSPQWQKPTPHPVYQVLGVLILWFGWYGFNGASTLAIVGYSGIAAHAMMTTTISAAAACLTTTLIGYLRSHFIDPALVNNGILAGLVGVTSACATCSLFGAFLIGVFAAPVYVLASTLVSEVLKLDDVVDAIAVHGACGAYGLIVPALFSTPYYYGIAYDAERKSRCAGIFYGGNPGGSLKAALATLLTIVAWVAGTMTILFAILKKLRLHRVSLEVERVGMDLSKHTGPIEKNLLLQDAHSSDPQPVEDPPPQVQPKRGPTAKIIPTTISVDSIKQSTEN